MANFISRGSQGIVGAFGKGTTPSALRAATPPNLGGDTLDCGFVRNLDRRHLCYIILE